MLRACGSPGAENARRAETDPLPASARRSLASAPSGTARSGAARLLIGRPPLPAIGRDARAVAVVVPGDAVRDPVARNERRAMIEALRRRRPGLELRHCAPDGPELEEALDALSSRFERVAVLPLRLFARELPRLRAGQTNIHVGEGLAAEHAVIEVALARIGLALPLLTPETSRTALLVVGPSADEASDGELEHVARRLRRAGGFARACCARVGSAGSTVLRAGERALSGTIEALVVFPFFLFHDPRLDRVASEAALLSERFPRTPVRLAAHLGAHPRLVDLLDLRLARLLAKSEASRDHR